MSCMSEAGNGMKAIHVAHDMSDASKCIHYIDLKQIQAAQYVQEMFNYAEAFNKSGLA